MSDTKPRYPHIKSGRVMGSHEAVDHLVRLFGIEVNGVIERIQVDAHTETGRPPSVQVDFIPFTTPQSEVTPDA